MTEQNDSDLPTPTIRPYNCDLSAKNNIRFIIDQLAASELKDAIGHKRKLKWLDMGDIVEVDIPQKPTDPAKITICDSERKNKHITFKCDFTVPFECLCLSDFTQYYKFSAAFRNTVYQFEFFRQRIPELEVKDTKDGNASVFSARVEMFITNLSDRTIQDNESHTWPGGGWDLRGASR